MSNWKDDKILLLIDLFSRPNSSFRLVRSEEDVRDWKPQDGAERKAFDALIAQEKRELLRAWYARLPALNPTADAFRRILELAIKEKLPLITR